MAQGNRNRVSLIAGSFHKQTDRETERQRNREPDRHRDRERQREIQRDRERYRETERERERDGQRARETERVGERDTNISIISVHTSLLFFDRVFQIGQHVVGLQHPHRPKMGRHLVQDTFRKSIQS